MKRKRSAKTCSPIGLIVAILLLPITAALNLTAIGADETASEPSQMTDTLSKTDCGDANDDGVISVDDVVYLFQYLYGDELPPIGDGDVDVCGSVNAADIMYFLAYIFLAGPPLCSGGTCYLPAGGNSVSLGCPITANPVEDDSIGIPVYITTDTPIRALSLGFHFSSSDLEITSVSFSGSVLPLPAEFISGFTLNSGDNAVLVYWHDIFTDLTPQYNGLLATIWAQVPEGTPNQTVDIDSTFVAPGGEFILCPAAGGAIKPAYGDCGTEDIVVLTPLDYVRLGADSIRAETENCELDFFWQRTCPEPAKIMQATNGFKLSTTGTASFTFVDIIPFPEHLSWFDLGGLVLVNYLPDSFVVGGSAMPYGPSGVPIFTERDYFTLVLDIGSGLGQICIDSAWVDDAAWSWSQMTCGQGGAPDRPLFLDKYGNDDHPICITIIEPCPPPTIFVLPVNDKMSDMLIGSHCDPLNFTFQADPGSGETIAGWSVISGPGVIDNNGNYTVSPLETGTYPVEIRVVNSCGASDDYGFDVIFTNVGPQFINSCTDTVYAVVPAVAHYDFDATDQDDCDDLVYSLVNIDPWAADADVSIDPNTGRLTWQSSWYDPGQYVFEVTVSATDGYATDECSVTVIVLPSFPTCYVDGDADYSGAVDIDDIVYIIEYIFTGGAEPLVCYISGDADGSGMIDIDDVVYLIAYVFAGGDEPACSPFRDVRVGITDADSDPLWVQENYDAINRTDFLIGDIPFGMLLTSSLQELLPYMLHRLQMLSDSGYVAVDEAAVESALTEAASLAGELTFAEVLSLPPGSIPALETRLQDLRDLGIDIYILPADATAAESMAAGYNLLIEEVPTFSYFKSMYYRDAYWDDESWGFIQTAYAAGAANSEKKKNKKCCNVFGKGATCDNGDDDDWCKEVDGNCSGVDGVDFCPPASEN